MSWTNPPTGPAGYGSGIVPVGGSPLPDLMIRQLQPGERVLWVGRPNRARLVQLSDLPALGFGALWTTIVVTAMAGLMRADPRPPVMAFFFVFLIIGVWSAIGSIVMRMIRSRRTVYAVTDRRLLTLVGETLRANDVRHIIQTQVTVRPDGSGDLFFTGELDDLAQVGQLPPKVQKVMFSLANNRRPGAAIGFQGVPDVLAVQSIVEGLRQGLS